MKNERNIKNCLECPHFRTLRKINKKGQKLKYEVYCEIDDKMKGRVTGIYDVLISKECPIIKRERQEMNQRYEDKRSKKRFRFLKNVIKRQTH